MTLQLRAHLGANPRGILHLNLFRRLRAFSGQIIFGLFKEIHYERMRTTSRRESVAGLQLRVCPGREQCALIEFFFRFQAFQHSYRRDPAHVLQHFHFCLQFSLVLIHQYVHDLAHFYLVTRHMHNFLLACYLVHKVIHALCRKI